MIKRVTNTILFIILFHSMAFSQSDHYDNIGKIYAVVAVVGVTLIGIVTFLFYLERKIKILEKMINDEHNRT